ERAVSGGVRQLLALEVLHLLAGVFELRGVPHLLDGGPDVPLLSPVVVRELEGELAHCPHPGVVDWLDPADLPDERLQLGDLRVMMLLPALQRRLPGPRPLRHRTVERRLFDLLVDLQLRLELRPEPAALPGAGLEDLGERTLGLLVLALQQVDRVHRRLLAAENCESYDRAIALVQSRAARGCLWQRAAFVRLR